MDKVHQTYLVFWGAIIVTYLFVLMNTYLSKNLQAAEDLCFRLIFRHFRIFAVVFTLGEMFTEVLETGDKNMFGALIFFSLFLLTMEMVESRIRNERENLLAYLRSKDIGS